MDRMKNMVILKNVQSNLVEEAIVVFKENVKIYKENFAKQNSLSSSQKSLKDDLCVKEAELIVNDYIDKIDDKLVEKKLNKKIKILKIINIVLVIAVIVLAII